MLETGTPREFLRTFQPSECADVLHLFVDARTSALYAECHIQADKLIGLSTTDVPLDPEDQPDYRANREIVSNNAAFLVMQDDAKSRRTFSNIVAEFTTEFDPDTPLDTGSAEYSARLRLQLPWPPPLEWS